MTEEGNKTEMGQIKRQLTIRVNCSSGKTSRDEISYEDKEDILGTTKDLTGLKVGQEMENFQEISLEITSHSRSRSGFKKSANRDRIRCRKYDHFAKDCQSMKKQIMVNQNKRNN